MISSAHTSLTEEERLLKLFGHQASGTASEEELQYLEELKIGNPDMYYALHSLSVLWDTSVTETDFVQNSFIRLIKRMKMMGIDIDDSEFK